MFVRLAREAHNHIDPDTSIRHEFTDFSYTILIELAEIAALHLLEDIIASTLQWNVEMWNKAAALGYKSNGLILE